MTLPSCAWLTVCLTWMEVVVAAAVTVQTRSALSTPPVHSVYCSALAAAPLPSALARPPTAIGLNCAHVTARSWPASTKPHGSTSAADDVPAAGSLGHKRMSPLESAVNTNRPSGAKPTLVTVAA